MNFLISAMLFAVLQGHSINMTVTPVQLHPGSPFILDIKGLITDTTYNIEFDKRVLPITSSSTVLLFGIDLNHPAGMDQIKLYAQGITIPITSTTIRIQQYAYPAQYLKLPKGFVELTPLELKRASKEQKELEKIFAGDTTPGLWDGGFIMPVHGVVTALFGVRRFLNGEPRSSHTGVDIAALQGTPVMATNNGIVCFRGNLFFGGNSIIVDHGQGIYSMYFHLKKYTVKNGDHVSKGQIIGYVGKTGRVTGPALHFGIRIMDSKVDPQLLFSLIRQ